MKTSMLLCKIVEIEKNIDIEKINFYVRELIKYKALEVSHDGMSLRLTERGTTQANKDEDRVSVLICKIFDNEGRMEVSKISYYIKELIKKGLICINEDGVSLSLTSIGLEYIKKG